MANEASLGDVERKVKPAAIALIVTGAITLLASLANLLATFLVPEDVMRDYQGGVDPRLQQLGGIIGILIGLVWVAYSVFLVVGGLQMLRLQSWLVALLANVAAIVPCYLCCCIGLPIGVWGFVVLQDEKVKEAFKT